VDQRAGLDEVEKRKCLTLPELEPRILVRQARIQPMLQVRRSRVRFLMRSLDFFNLHNPSSCTMALGLTHPLREMSTRNLPGGKGRPARKAETLTAVCEPIV
jgi:hypothetical protein